MKFDENLATIHAYLCADGYVIKNPKVQRQKYYYVGFRNTNLILLKDFQKKFKKIFGVKPSLREGERCIIGSKEIYKRLIGEFNSFYSSEWQMPKLNKKLSNFWLRAFFDCEGWVFCKSHQNRHIGLDSINEKGLDQIIVSLNKKGIKTIKKTNKKRKMYRIFIYGKENLRLFQKEINFLHPGKREKLKEVIGDYVVYTWDFPKDENKSRRVIKKLFYQKAKIRKKKYIRIISKEERNLKKLKKLLKKFYRIECLIYNRVNGLGTSYYELNINRIKEIEKLINLKLIPNILCIKKN